MHTVIEIGAYLARAKKAGVTDDERQGIIDMIAADPEAGAVMKGTGTARKVRFAKDGGGKSSGYRVITHFDGVDVPVFLLDVYPKGQKANLSAKERNELAAVLSQIAAAYRASTAAAAKRLKEKQA